MILVDRDIRDAVARKDLMIENFDDECVQPASYDLRIGDLVYAPSHPDRPYDLSKNGGAYRMPPYGNVVLTTYENLRLPQDMIGRIGLKSGFARRGIFASTGPQIDPGFEGKLFISAFNVTAASHVLSRRDTFLTIEFHSLDRKPEHTYSGPYQGKTTVGAEVLDALVRLEGMTLSQMQSQFTELEHHVKEWSAFATRFDEFLSELKEHTRVIGELAKNAEVQSAVEARAVEPDQAATEILDLFKKRGRLFYSDIAQALRLDFATVIAACKTLADRGLIEAESNGETGTKKTRDKRTSRPRRRTRG